MHPFEYRNPDTLDEVRALLAEYGGDAKLLAGGQSLMVLLRQELLSPTVVVGLGNVSEAKGVTSSESALELGAMVTYRSITDEPAVRTSSPILAHAAGSVGSVHIRNRGTIGGSVCHADPAGDVPTVLLVLDAELRASSVDHSTSIPMADVFTDLFETQLTDTDVLEAVLIPQQPTGASFGYRRFSYREGEYPLAVAACRLEWQNGTCTGARIAVGGGDAFPKRLEAGRSCARRHAGGRG